jgi:hypothetical protein
MKNLYLDFSASSYRPISLLVTNKDVVPKDEPKYEAFCFVTCSVLTVRVVSTLPNPQAGVKIENRQAIIKKGQ